MKAAVINGQCRWMGPAKCRDCRSLEAWRASVGTPDICPHGITLDSLPIASSGGPGTELKRLLGAMGIKPHNCSCNAMAARMDKWGADGCREHLPEIVISLVKEANTRNWMKIIPLKGLWAEMLINQAISDSEKLTA